jgi:hypothetical protein
MPTVPESAVDAFDLFEQLPFALGVGLGHDAGDREDVGLGSSGVDGNGHGGAIRLFSDCRSTDACLREISSSAPKSGDEKHCR